MTFQTKRYARKKIENYDESLITKRYSQKIGCDYRESFNPVMEHNTIRSSLNAAVYKNVDIIHLGIKTAISHGNLLEVVFITKTEVCIAEVEEEKLCKLNKGNLWVKTGG